MSEKEKEEIVIKSQDGGVELNSVNVDDVAARVASRPPSEQAEATPV